MTNETLSERFADIAGIGGSTKRFSNAAIAEFAWFNATAIRDALRLAERPIPSPDATEAAKAVVVVKETVVGPHLFVAGIEVRSWFGTLHNSEAYRLANALTKALATLPLPTPQPDERDVSDERNPQVEGASVEKFGGKYGGPGKLVASWTDEHGEVMNIVAHRIEGGYGTFKHVYPAKLVRAQQSRAPQPDGRDEALRVAEKALTAAMPWVDGGPAGRWREGVLIQITTALASIAAAKSKGGEG